MEDQEIIITLQSRPTEAGFDILPINAGEAKGHGVTFSADVLKQSLAMWDGLPCFLDHAVTGSQSVRNLAGALHLPLWNEQEQGIQAVLVPGGPGAADLQALRLAAKADPALMAAVGFSAHLYIVQENGQVKKINKVVSVDCVIDPARGGKFLQTITTNNQSPITNNHSFQGERTMSEDNHETNQDQTNSEDTAATQALLDAQKKAEAKKHTADESVRQLRLQTCRTLLKVTLESSKLPLPIQSRVERKFLAQVDKGKPFEPVELETAIQDEQQMLSDLTAAGHIQGPGRVTEMHNTADQLQAAVEDMFGVQRETQLANVKPAHLTGIRELYLMLTGDYDLHGGYFGERIQLATTTDFSGLVKNALNKVVTQNWDAMGAAGYNWWEKIVQGRALHQPEHHHRYPGRHGRNPALRGRRRRVHRARSR